MCKQMNIPINFNSLAYNYAERSGNLKAEAVGEVKSEKHFPIFSGNQIFKPLTKSKPFSTPLFAYAEVFWSNVIDEYFMPAPRYQLAFCEGYEAEMEKYYDYGTVVPSVCGENEVLMNLLEFFRENPDEQVDIDNYENYCQMFYDYTAILESDFFQNNKKLAEQLAMQILISVLRGDQNYHYENVSFLCDSAGKIIDMAPMIDHEFSTYFMFPDDLVQHVYWFEQLKRSIVGKDVSVDEFSWISNPKERKLMEKSAVCISKNLMYIKEHYPEVASVFLESVKQLEKGIDEREESFQLKRNLQYPESANSYAFRIGRARYKEKDEEKAKLYERTYGEKGGKIDFEDVNKRSICEIKKIIELLKEILGEEK